MVVAQLAEQSLPTPQIYGSNQVVIQHLMFTVETTKHKISPGLAYNSSSVFFIEGQPEVHSPARVTVFTARKGLNRARLQDSEIWDNKLLHNEVGDGICCGMGIGDNVDNARAK